MIKKKNTMNWPLSKRQMASGFFTTDRLQHQNRLSVKAPRLAEMIPVHAEVGKNIRNVAGINLIPFLA